MQKNANASNSRHSNIGALTQIRKILSGLEKNREIISFEKFNNKEEDVLIYRIFFKINRFFYLQIRPASIFHPIKGVEVGELESWKLTLLIDETCSIPILKRILREDIKERRAGLALEEQFTHDVRELIRRDREVSYVISGIREVSDFSDMVEKIDRVLMLVDGREVPIQIKTGIMAQKKHKLLNSKIPSIIYEQAMLKNGLLKKYILRIIKSYPDWIENL